MLNELQTAQELGHFGGAGDGLGDLMKAMQAGQITGRDTDGQELSYEPLKVESLETTLKLLDFRLQDIRLLNKMPKLTAHNTVEEYLQLQSYGENRGGFYNEGELSDVEDSTYVRRSELIKYIQVTGEVTLQAQMVRSYVDALRKEVNNKTMWVQRKANQSLTKADADIVPQEFNSLYKQHASIGSGADFLYNSIEEYYDSPVVIDLRGASLKQQDVEEGAVIVDDNFGYPTDLFGAPVVLSTLMQDYFERQRLVQETGSGYNGVIGTVASAIGTSINPKIGLSSDKFMKADKAKTLATSATSDKAPPAPTPDVTTPVAVTADNLSKFQSSETGSVFYAVAALNRYGESSLVAMDSTPVAISVGDSIDLKFTPSGGSVPATGYVIYRSEVTSSTDPNDVTFFPLFKVSEAERANGYDGGGNDVVRDRGRILPNTETAFLTQMSEDVLSFKQLAPISKLDLAVLSTSRRFIVFNFATPHLYAPKKFVKWVNVGKKLTS